jgi:hypothetical protein
LKGKEFESSDCPIIKEFKEKKYWWKIDL